MRASALATTLITTTIAAVICLPNAARAQSPSADRVERALAKEPPIEQVQRAALEANGYADDDLDRWSSRARWSHVLPQVKGQVAWLDQRDHKARYREDLDSDEAGTMLRDRAQNNFYDDTRLRTVYSVELRWDLSGLVYDRSETTIAREVRQRTTARARLLDEVTQAYFMRRRHVLERTLTPSKRWRKHLELQLDIDRQTARLDAMTGGWFGSALQRAGEEGPR
jgi:hypothetical protein